MKNLNLPTSPRRTSSQIFGLFSRTLPIIGAMALAGQTSAADCIDSSKIVANPIIPQVVKYVCGCNDATYMNAYEASAKGVVSYTEGRCREDLFKEFQFRSIGMIYDGEPIYLSTPSVQITDTAEILVPKQSINWSEYSVDVSSPSILKYLGEGKFSAVDTGRVAVSITDLLKGYTKTIDLYVFNKFGGEVHRNAIVVGDSSFIAVPVMSAGGQALSVSAQIRYEQCQNASIETKVIGNEIEIVYPSESIPNCTYSSIDIALYSYPVSKTLKNLPAGEYHLVDSRHDTTINLNVSAKEQLASLSVGDTAFTIGEYRAITSNLYKTILWDTYKLTSSDNAVAVAKDGTITAIGTGNAIITVVDTTSGESVQFTISVLQTVKSSDLFLAETSIVSGDSTYITWDARCRCQIDWTKYTITSSVPAVATASATGQIIGIAPGTTVINVTELSTGKSTILSIIVTEKLPRYFGAAERYVGDTIRMETCPACKNFIDWDSYSIISSDPAVAKAIGDGKIVGIAAGTATITLTSIATGSSIYFEIKFVNKDTLPIELSSMYLAEANIVVGNTTFITWDARCRCQIDWTKYTITTSYPETATVTATGQISGVAVGEDSIIVTEISSGKSISLLLTVVPSIGDISLVESMYFESNSIVLGSATRIKCEQSAGIDWSKYTITATSGLSVTADGIVRGLKAETGSVTIIDVERNKVRTLPIRVTYNFFDVEHVEMYVGDTVNVPINRDYAEYFDIQVDGADYFKFDAANFTATATSVGAGYAGVLFYYKSDNTFAEGLKFLIKEKPVVTPVGDASVLADMYLGRNSIDLGDTTNFFCKQNVQIDWSKFSISSFDGPSVKDGVITGSKTHANAVIIVTHIATNTQRKFILSVNYNYFTTDHIEMNVGDTVKVPVNPDYAQFFYLDVVGADYFKFNKDNMTATATAVGEGYAGVLCYYKSDSSFAQGIKFTIKDTASTVVKPEIKTVKLLNGGYTLEITFDKPIALYPGIEADFAVAMNTVLKANGTFTVTKVMAKEGNPNTLVLVMADAVPVEGFTVQYKTSKTFAVATSTEDNATETAMLYPNPAQNSVSFNAEGLEEASISTIGGQLILQANADGNTATIDISQLPAGQYIASFITANGTVTQMLTVK